MEGNMKHENENENQRGDGPELELEHERDAGGISSSSNHEPKDLSSINPLSDTTTDTLEPDRPTITSNAPSDPLQLKQTSTGREGRKSVRIDHPYSSVYGLGVIEDQNRNGSIIKDMNAHLSTSTSGPPGTETEQQGQVEHQNQNQESSDGTWNSNTLTLASSSGNQDHNRDQNQAGMKGDPIYTREQADKIQIDWEETWERQKREKWQEKVRRDLEGWRGGHG